jgi:ethanolamine utilization microcompartment shell protein EutS
MVSIQLSIPPKCFLLSLLFVTPSQSALIAASIATASGGFDYYCLAMSMPSPE